MHAPHLSMQASDPSSVQKAKEHRSPGGSVGRRTGSALSSYSVQSEASGMRGGRGEGWSRSGRQSSLSMVSSPCFKLATRAMRTHASKQLGLWESGL